MPKRAPRLLRAGKKQEPAKAAQKAATKKAAAGKSLQTYNNRAISRYVTK